MAFTIDIPNRRLITDTLVNTVQEINDAARDFEDFPDVVALNLIDPLNRDGIIATSGKDDLGLGVFAPVILRFINDWRIYYLPQSGPSWVNVQVVGGTMIATNTFNDAPIEDSAFVNWSYTVSQAGALLQQPALEAASFGGSVAIDIINGETGTEFPTGTRLHPSDNLQDAHTIAANHGLNAFTIINSMTIASEDFSDGHVFIGASVSVVVTLDTATNVENCEFKHMTIQGVLDNQNVIRECSIMDLTHNNGFIFQSSLFGTIVLGGSDQSMIMDCFSGVAGGGAAQYPSIDMGGSGNTLALRNYAGGVGIINSTGADFSSLDFNSGRVVFDSSCTGGDFTIRGVCEVTDNSSGATVIDKTITDTTEHTRKLLRNRQELVDTGSGVVMRTWDDDGATVLESNPVTDPNDAEPDLDAGAITKRGVPT